MVSRFCLALLMLTGIAPHDAATTGRYRLTGEHDVASQLVLHPDGKFDYFLSAGALDEMARGNWDMNGASVRLTTEPKPVPPAFTAHAPARTGDGFAIKVVWPDGRGIAGVDFRIGFDEGEVLEGYTQEFGWTLPADERRKPQWVELSVPMHDLVSPRFPIDVDQGNSVTFVLKPNGLGVIDFDQFPLDIAPGRLIMHRGEASLVYIRDGAESPPE